VLDNAAAFRTGPLDKGDLLFDYFLPSIVGHMGLNRPGDGIGAG
jgi:hypothetical protein